MMDLANNYRPATWDDVLGQDPTVTCLRTAIEDDKVSTSYLFTGPRGVGKTTVARVFAKSVGAHDVDILEWDAASNGKVEDARRLIDMAGYMPGSGPKKVFIVDEVHMMTTQAFNALLKLIEEPPKYLLLIFCTTEQYKIPDTIKSRCQRFSFRCILDTRIRERLDWICRQEKAVVPDKVLTRISRMAKGSLRDAIKFLEQAITIGASQEHVFEMLGIPDADDVLIGLREKNAVTTVKALDLLYQTGYNTDQIVMEMIDQLRLGLITRLQNKQPTAMLTRLIEVLHGSLRVPQEVLEARLVLFISEME